MRRLLFLLLVLALSLSSLALAQDEEKVLVIGHTEGTDSLDPAVGYIQTSGMIHQATYDGLVTWPADSNDEIQPNLAKDWKISDDGLVYTFTLRDDVVFSDGSPLVAEDFVFSIMRTKNLKAQPSFLADTIASVEAPDDYTLVVTLSEPDPAILAKMIYPAALYAVNADVVREQGGTDAEDAAETDTAEEWLNNNSAGTGPYVLEKWEPQVETVLVRNENYWGEAPYYDRVIIRNIPEAATQKIALEAGDIDLALEITADQVASLESNEAIEVLQASTFITFFLHGNQDPNVGGPMSDPLVQRAVRYALDYEGMVTLAGGAAVHPPSMVPVGFLGALEPGEGITRDVETAKSLLEEAGYADGFDFTLEYPEYTFLGVNISTLAQKVQADLAEVGINVDLAPAELLTQLEAYRDGREGFALWWWGPDYIDPNDRLVFLPGGKVGKRANWTMDMADETAQSIWDRATTVTEPAERAKVFVDFQEYLMENSPWAPLVQPGIQIAYRAGLEGVSYNPQWMVDFADMSMAE